MTSRTYAKRQERSHLKSPMRSAKSKRTRSSANGACMPRYSRRESSCLHAHAGASWQKIVPSMDGISPKPHPSLRKRCPLKPLGGTNIGASTYGISSITSFLISKAQYMSLAFLRTFRECLLLASAISERQDTAAYLRVLASALRNYGAPEAIVTDSGGVFYSKRAMAIYEALDIRKERIDPRQSWQNYREAHFGIMRRLADYYLNKAPTLDEMKKAHRKFIRDYNCQIHFAHRERNDNRHSPQDVLRGVLARTLPVPTLARIFFAAEFTRHLDRSGYIRFRRWRFYAESGLAKQEVQVSFYTSTLKIEYQETELAFYTMEWEDNKRIKEVKNPCLIETGYRSPQ